MFSSAPGTLDKEINDLSLQSEQVTANSVFFGLPGKKSHGAHFIENALAKGALFCALDPKNLTANEVAQLTKDQVVFVEGLTEKLSSIVEKFYQSPSEKLKLIAVTGTSGKTTVTHLLEKILSDPESHAGIIGTIENRIGSYKDPSQLTTPDIISLNRFLSKAVQLKAKYVAIEASSHAIYLNRIEGLIFEGACFTGLSRDHLDFHSSMEEYFEAKALLFEKYLVESRQRGARGAFVIGGNDEFSKKLHQRLVKEGFGHLGLNAEDVVPTKENFNGVSIDFTFENFRYKSALQGQFNFENVRTSVLISRLLGRSPESIQKGLDEMNLVPGRLEKFEGDGKTIWVDYAHKPDALSKVLQLLKKMPKTGKLITIVGCGGDRDRGKRPEMAQVASQLSDFVVLTSDNPRSEDPKKILDEMESGIKGHKNYNVIVDRKIAIQETIQKSQKGDWILVAGKGHERSPFLDMDVVKESFLIKKNKT